MTPVPGMSTTEEPPAWVLRRINSSTYGWGIFAVDPPHAPLVVDGSTAIGITRWEGRQTLGLMGCVWIEAKP